MILAVLNQKGGVGKTTTTVTLGHGLAHAGYRVLLIDLDSQGHVAEALGLDKAPDLYDLLIDDDYDAHTATGRENLDAVLSDKSTQEAGSRLFDRPGREFYLKRALKDVQSIYAYDYVVIDTPPEAGLFHVSALVAADEYLIPVQLEHLAVTGVAEEINTVASLLDMGLSDAHFLGVLPTFWDRRLNEARVLMEQLLEDYQERVWPPIPVDARVAQAAAYGETPWEYGANRACYGVEIDGALVGGYSQVIDRLTGAGRYE